MTLTILSAAYANEDGTAAVAITAQAAAVALSATDTPDAWAAMLAAVTPAPFVPPAPRRVVTALGFMERLTQAERIAIRAVARAPGGEAIEDWLDMLRAAQEVDLADPRTVAGVAAIVAAGLLTNARAAALLAG